MAPQWCLLSTVALLGVCACGGSDWAAVDHVWAGSPDATVVTLELDYCDAGQNPLTVDSFVESPSEVRVRLDIPIPSGDRDDCAGIAQVQLTSPIGERTVVDDRTGERHVVEFGPADAPPDTTPPPVTWFDEAPYALADSAAWSVQEAVDPAPGSVASIARPPMEWYIEYLDGNVLAVVASHAVGLDDARADLETLMFEFEPVNVAGFAEALEGRSTVESNGATVVLLDTGHGSISVHSYDATADQLRSLAQTIRPASRDDWIAIGGVIL